MPQLPQNLADRSQGKLRDSTLDPAFGRRARVSRPGAQAMLLALGQGKTSAGLGGEASRAVSAEPGGQLRSGHRGSRTESSLHEEEPSKPAWPEQADGPMLSTISDPTWLEKSSHPWLEQAEQCTLTYGQKHVQTALVQSGQNLNRKEQV